MTAAATRSVEIERELSHPPEKIWRALTQGPLIKEWLMDNDFQPVVGHRFNFRSTPMPQWNGVIDCEVLVVEPNSKLSYSWGALGLETVVAWTLTSTSSGTLLRMEQSGFGPDQDANYRGATYGWQKFVGNLERVVAGLASA
ncbi:MAG: SRPBCC domain-containing protein [Bradyrhizobium sp.]|uniref:SRPBCC family protein n=1 Tax=Bradyrhizobium sp. TaxID=376 RepID=UPI001C295D6E|nr:SRPBCC domain-containing protein [Bradyrhizobium sp.]MBU6463376.1 SRPBCC domain-containing protein [Pseudomonadota bacterium]MDE2067433.1 SRPBCC domain-containing protein [Bradyrhizobium sp.]MDE2242400.1 SRPBCC domain-containing protein [Bradyrhizobium sp.]MDE2468864.1 SRPBCC domain-containing protein [Bradyrhizobium sp.]